MLLNGGLILFEAGFQPLGIEGLDAALGGGVLRNGVVLISFDPGSGELAFSSEIIRSSLFKGDYVVHVDFDHGPDYSLNSIMGLGVDSDFLKGRLKAEYEAGKLRFIDCFTAESPQDRVESTAFSVILDNPYNLSKLLFTMKKVRESISPDCAVKWVFSNLTSLSINLPVQDVIRFCRAAFRLHKQFNDQAIYYVNRCAHSPEFLSIIYQLVDAVIELRTREMNNRVIRFLRVVKNQFKDHITSDLTYKIDKGRIIITLLK
ncbi:MAG: RAD55 family ATPase [Candidatus Odinarchaeum yellowstonii]|jgi:KaiC/GvpD/RAD55 family RecA-like ATPase|uniref:RAD55 family ATPase n=1 Tax=Odinarchaeota yellowstonii (strain LCB_4) TaxID=1841599 RepID=A0AAF0D250_ODILC|nr:MAG: RAD55 family ATPase [Candidatus Odinarchaeum yellowstonii]